MEDKTTKIAAYCLSAALSNESWKDIGYGKRPKYGSIIQRFRTQWKVAIERTILKEFLIIISAAHIAGRIIDKSAIKELSLQYTVFKNKPIFVYLGYTSKHEAVDHLCSSITQYVNRDSEGWSSLLFDRLDIQNIPDEKLKAKLFVGCVNFCSTVRWMIALMEKKKTAPNNWIEDDSDPEI